MFILDVAYSQQCVISIFISENNIWIALLISRHRGPFIRRYKNETILYFEHVLHVRNIYNTSFWCCDRKVQMIGKKKTIITAIYSFVKNRQSAAVNVNRVLYVIVEHVRVGTGSVLALWSKQGWYLSYFAFLNLHLQFTCVAVSVETKTDQEFVLSNRTPWPANLPDGYRIIQLSCLLKRTL